MVLHRYLCLVFVVLVISSCDTSKKTSYFQNLDWQKPTEETIANYSPLTIQTNDILSINVTSLNPHAWSDTSSRDLGYLVDQKGEIMLPLIGRVKAAGLTTSAVSEHIRQQLLDYLKEPSVVVRILNFKVAVFGDVMRPDVYKVTSERVTVNEAISMAGDLNITAKRNGVLLIREVDGKREYIPLDLTSVDFIRSPYFYLKNNDALYILPGRAKYASVDGTYRTLSLMLSAISILAIIITR